MTEREIIAGLLDAFEQYEWVYDDNPPRVCCAHGCGAKHSTYETPYKHKPGCKIEALLAAARAALERPAGTSTENRR